MTFLLCFLCGSLVSAIGMFLYSLYAENQSHCLLAAHGRHEYDRGYAQGYHDRAMQSATGKLQTIQS